MRRTLLAGVVALIATGANAQAVIDGSDASLQKNDVAAVVQLVARYLRDPSTAEGKGLVDAGGVYCGFVNAKTKFGGYAGFRRFVAAIEPRPFILFVAARNEGQFEPSAAIISSPE